MVQDTAAAVEDLSASLEASAGVWYGLYPASGVELLELEYEAGVWSRNLELESGAGIWS